MKTSSVSRLFILAAACLSLVAPLARGEGTELSAEEKAAGWKLLFDGKSLDGWRGFKKEGPPDRGWTAENGILKHAARGRGGDIITVEKFDNFDLRWEWRVAPGGNSGVKYFVIEDRNSAIGHEYQLVDNKRHPDAKVPGGERVTAAFYDVLRPHGAKPKPAGEWNESRILVRGNHVEHWLNGEKVLEYELESEALKKAIADSKFRTTDRFGTKLKGHILFQDHGDEVAFRNVRILRLSEP